MQIKEGYVYHIKSEYFDWLKSLGFEVVEL